MNTIENKFKWWAIYTRFFLIWMLQGLGRYVIGKGAIQWMVSILMVDRKDKVNIYNLWRLYCYIRDKVSDKQFNMYYYLREEPECGTVGCLLGYSPAAIDYEKDIIEFSTSWNTSYTDSASYWYSLWSGTINYMFLFSGEWAKIDNTRSGALNRIKHVILHDDFDYGICDDRSHMTVNHTLTRLKTLYN